MHMWWNISSVTEFWVFTPLVSLYRKHQFLCHPHQTFLLLSSEGLTEDDDALVSLIKKLWAVGETLVGNSAADTEIREAGFWWKQLMNSFHNNSWEKKCASWSTSVSLVLLLISVEIAWLCSCVPSCSRTLLIEAGWKMIENYRGELDVWTATLHRYFLFLHSDFCTISSYLAAAPVPP